MNFEWLEVIYTTLTQINHWNQYSLPWIRFTRKKLLKKSDPETCKDATNPCLCSAHAPWYSHVPAHVDCWRLNWHVTAVFDLYTTSTHMDHSVLSIFCVASWNKKPQNSNLYHLTTHEFVSAISCDCSQALCRSCLSTSLSTFNSFAVNLHHLTTRNIASADYFL